MFDGKKCCYYSYGPESLGFPNNNMYARVFDTVAEAKAYITGNQKDIDGGDVLSDYQTFIGWEITAEQAEEIKNIPPTWAGTHWDVLLHNCWHMVFASISPVLGASHIQSIFPPSPEANYNQNILNTNEGSGSIANM